MAAGRLTVQRERLAGVILVIFVGLTLLGVAAGWRASQDGFLLRARMPEGGGWSPSELSATVGKPLQLRLTSDDVAHSFAVGQTDWPVVDVLPGEVTKVTLMFERPGKYVYYCTRWCGPNHWRMRGTIEVNAPSGSALEPHDPGHTPLFVELGLDIDAPHPAAVTPPARPSAAVGQALLTQVPAVFRTEEYLRTHSPSDTWQDLRLAAFSQALSDQQIWNLVAALWRSGTDQAHLNQGQTLYAQNCAACHGENGAGDGVFANQMGTQGDISSSPVVGHNLAKPADFTDPATMLGASPVVLQGKIVRGGMGTGMPYWGPIFTENQIWAIVDYLYSFQFNQE